MIQPPDYHTLGPRLKALLLSASLLAGCAASRDADPDADPGVDDRAPPDQSTGSHTQQLPSPSASVTYSVDAWQWQFENSPFDPRTALFDDRPIAEWMAQALDDPQEWRRLAAIGPIGETAYGQSVMDAETVFPNPTAHASAIRSVHMGLASDRTRVLAPTLGAALKDESVLVRREAAKWLAMMGPAAAPATPQLTSACADNDPQVRALVARALFYISGDSTWPVEESIRLLEADAAPLQMLALSNLDVMGVAAGRAIPFVERLSDAGDSSVHSYSTHLATRLRALLQERASTLRKAQNW